VAKFGKDPIHRTKVIVRKPVWTPARHTQSHNTARLEKVEVETSNGFKCLKPKSSRPVMVVIVNRAV